MSIAGDLIRGHTDAIILARLMKGDSYGYEINKVISTLSSGRFELKEATLYTAFKRLEELGLRDKTVVWAGGRIAEKEEEHKYYEDKIANEGTAFMGTDAFFGPDSTPEECVAAITKLIEAKNQ